jgi:multidrug resistance efflux pump
MDDSIQDNDLSRQTAIRPAQPDLSAQVASLLSAKVSTQPPPMARPRRTLQGQPKPEPTARADDTQVPQPEAPPSPRTVPAHPKPAAKFPRLPRFAKRIAAVALLGIGTAALMTNANYISSNNAVVTAHVVSLRAPIEGLVTTNAAVVGNPVTAGIVLAEVTNALADDRQAANIRAHIARLGADLDAAQQEHATLTAMLEDLNQRATRHRTAKLAQLAWDIARVDRDRAARQQALDQLVRDMQRKIALRGTVSESDIETSEAAVRVATQQVASLDQQKGASQVAAQSVGAGVLVEANSANDVAYSDQRADEVRERLADLTRVISSMQAESTEAHDQLAAETSMLQRLQTATITVPSQGMIWRAGAATGERVAPGDLLAQIVDCGAEFLAVAVPQNRLPDIDLNAVVTFRLAGEHQDRSSHIVAITGESAVRGDAALATTPAAETTPMASVLVAVRASPNTSAGCLVGRTARVLLPATGGGWLGWAKQHMPMLPSAVSKASH